MPKKQRRDKSKRPSDKAELDRCIWYVLALILLGLVAYSNIYACPFVFDSERIRGEFGGYPLWPPGEWITATQRPVAIFTLTLNYNVHGYHVAGYHFVNVIIHVTAACVLFGLVRDTLRRIKTPERYSRDATGIALAVAALWLVHPLQTQAVTYTIQRMESLTGLFYLLTVFFFSRGVLADSPKYYFVLSVLCCCLGMGTKEVMVTAPVVVLWYDRAFVAKSWREIVAKRWPYYLGLIGSWGCLALIMTQLADLKEVDIEHISSFDYAKSQAGVILHYLRLSVFPVGLCLDYDWQVAQSIWEFVPHGIVVVALVVFTVVLIFWRPQLSFLGAWFFIILSPTSSFVTINDLAVEHRMYLSLAAVMTLLVAGFYELLIWLQHRGIASFETRQKVCRFTAVGFVAVLSVMTFLRNFDYRSSVSIWQDVVDKAPHNTRGHNNLAHYLRRSKDFAGAERHWKESIRLDPTDPLPYNDLGAVLRQNGRTKEAVKLLSKAIELDPTHYGAHYNLGSAFFDDKDVESARDCFEVAVELRPDAYEARYALGFALRELGRMDEGIVHFERALKVQPKNQELRKNITDWHLEQGRSMREERSWKRAEHHYSRVVKLMPRLAIAHYEFATVLVELNKRDLAIRHLNGAIRLNNSFSQARVLLRNLTTDSSGD